ncbi:uncharacterized protein KGF55_002722 [Candida pseudojiufengensis]|uniref:uncharacterized protein n=1 Tax=Candida pseudojiufengensis TaxID=497109 RepID=UPI0022259001|nr:uncharacterized protein KGF55_002722 [Candida pseudojiufengensis]KAI5962930.1 hypothetical protein KGF55_002722 [Candida pseudojiufengensis]
MDDQLQQSNSMLNENKNHQISLDHLEQQKGQEIEQSNQISAGSTDIQQQSYTIQPKSQPISIQSTPSSSPKQPIYKKKHSNYNRMYNIYSSSQINPNYSSTNLSKITHNNNNSNNGPYTHYNDSNVSINSIPIALPSPPLSSVNSFVSMKNIYNLPLSPPYSESNSPEPSKLDYNNLKELNEKLLQETFINESSSKTNYLNKIRDIIPPINFKICSLCFIWYFFSIISSNSIKLILNNYKYPITVTQFQFSFNILLSLILLVLSNNFKFINKIIPQSTLPTNKSIKSFIKPTKLILITTIPMGCFQFIGHLTSHKATSMIPVSLVHTIKALSPIVTVFIYRILFKKQYKLRTYLTLIPLIIGIMMTCYKPKKSKVIPGQIINPEQNKNNNYIIGLTFAFCSMLIFVSQNIFAKNRLTSANTTTSTANSLEIPMSKAGTKKLDNLTILYYCSIVGFIFTFPIYLTSEIFNLNFSLIQLNFKILCLISINGLSHFFQSILAFQILGLLSPIDYTIANILKRIFIIFISFIWELKNFTNMQSLGLFFTLFGLYCYDRWGTQRKDMKNIVH